MEQDTKTIGVSIGGSTEYFRYDADKQEIYLRSGKNVTINEQRLQDFLATAKMLDIGVSEI